MHVSTRSVSLAKNESSIDTNQIVYFFKKRADVEISFKYPLLVSPTL